MAIPTAQEQEEIWSENALDQADTDLVDEDVEAGVAGLDELEAPPPDENPTEAGVSYHRSLEDERALERRASERELASRSSRKGQPLKERLLVQLYTYSWLIFFSILGTLARRGVEWIAYYPNAPVLNNVLWANAGGCFFLGFLQEDRALFAKRRGRTTRESGRTSSRLGTSDSEKESQKMRAEHLASKKRLPLYIGLAVGFCGSFTSYSSFMRDMFLALSNDVVARNSGPVARSAGWSVCAVLAVAIVEIAVSLTALQAGAHLSILLLPLLSRVPNTESERYLNPLGVVLGIGCWLGAIFMAIWPLQNRWRGDIVFALVLAPLGCILRFILSTQLNRAITSFPMGTFSANMFGTMVLGMAYNLQRAPLSSAGKVGGGVLGCQVLSGVMEGFCGCLTTVSTWVAELRGLRKRHAYVYGASSVVLGFTLLVAIIGSLRWTVGLSEPVCNG